MNRDLYLALLAMDAYNRGYGQGISELNAFGEIGNTTIKSDSFVLGGTLENRLDAQSGFYAIAYDVSQAGIAGLSGTVVSYRGTNFRGSFFDLNSPIWLDVLNGWNVGAGVAGAQAGLALDFYNAVKSADEDPRTAGIVSTGHSLGRRMVSVCGHAAGHARHRVCQHAICHGAQTGFAAN